MNYPILNLPSAELQIDKREDGSYVFDAIRKKYLLLTPEEWVRQHFIHLLISHLNYPSGLFQLERQHTYQVKLKRTDILILGKNGHPFLLVECKAHSEKLSEQTLNQIAVYNKTLQAHFIAITNGIKHFIWKLENQKYIQLEEFPVYEG